MVYKECVDIFESEVKWKGTYIPSFSPVFVLCDIMVPLTMSTKEK